MKITVERVNRVEIQCAAAKQKNALNWAKSHNYRVVFEGPEITASLRVLKTRKIIAEKITSTEPVQNLAGLKRLVGAD